MDKFMREIIKLQIIVDACDFMLLKIEEKRQAERRKAERLAELNREFNRDLSIMTGLVLLLLVVCCVGGIIEYIYFK